MCVYVGVVGEQGAMWMEELMRWLGRRKPESVGRELGGGERIERRRHGGEERRGKGTE